MKFCFEQILKVSAFYVEKQKRFILKKIFKPLSISKQKALFTDPIFSKGFGPTFFAMQGRIVVRVQ